MSSTKMKRFFSSVGVNLLVVLALLFILTPVIWLFLTSIKTRSEMFQTPITLFPKTFDFGNYVKIWEKIQFGTFIKNSLIMSLYNTVVTLAIASMAAYSLSRYTFKGKDFFLRYLLVSQMFPAVLVLIPLFLMVKRIGLLGTFTGLEICYLTITIPFCTWALKNYFDKITPTIEESAMIDGCSFITSYIKIFLPVALPGLVSVGTYCFLSSWNEYLFTVVFMQTQDTWTLPVGLAALSGQFALDMGLLTAGGIISLVPAVIIMLFLQKYLLEGMLAGSVKE
ncbi:carbohydrate ABC transporter permease [Sediminispirochaeta smaragdinae]|uniref:Binding-protein-dependent transport systems inner membrane component n=1 Tax=Sediminispirochaeta smaragdinae (strain DSM 11293 / JCM 15392 / SEBR 4228) TaxID=573413 RepID=E1RBZ5_SEDSS|nr:carbohydrate ABC transporter permease [Sediminispirochaeta smaragdinae]ADK79875.1 binding-protein-dependent transport systems inner membrane component [Sediminispirochaeta smaragdinae DSM 11293]